MTWLDELRKQVEITSLSEVAAVMGVSKTTVSLLVNGKYGADTAKMQTIVESVFMGHTVECPVLGQIPKHKCSAHQSSKHVGSTPHAIRLWKACRSGCPHSDLQERLHIPVRLSSRSKPTREKTEHTKSQESIRPYDAQSAVARLERQARTDSESTMGGNFQRLYIELLKREITALGHRYNRLLKQ